MRNRLPFWAGSFLTGGLLAGSLLFLASCSHPHHKVTDRPAEAMPYLDYAINNNTAGLNLLPVKAAAGEISRMQKALAVDSANLTLLNRIADAYFKVGDKEAAQKYVGKVLRVDPKNADALSLKIKTP